MGLFSEEELFGMTIRESATDGSDFTNPAADYRRLFLGEDGQLHVKDSAGTVTDIGSGSGAPTDATYVTTTAHASLSAEVVHPEFADNGGSTAVDMSAAATGTSVTANALTGYAGRIVFAANSNQYWDVASAVSTGDFDYRCRITSWGPDAAANASGNNPIFYFGVTDSSRTSTTGLYTRVTGMGNNATTLLQAQGYTGLGTTAINGTQSGLILPMILRVARSGTTVNRYISLDNGASWNFLASSTSSLDVAKVGLWGNPNNATVISHQIVVHWVRSV
jgi:hypothetical protein